MENWENQFAVLGQQLIEVLGQKPEHGPRVTRALAQQLNQIHGQARDNEDEGTPNSLRKDKDNMAAHAEAADMTVNLKDEHGKDVSIPIDAFAAANRVFNKQQARGRVTARQYNEEEDEDLANDPDVQRALREAKKRDIIEGHSLGWRTQSKRIAWELVETAGKAVLICGSVVLVFYVLSKMLPNDMRGLPVGNQ